MSNVYQSRLIISEETSPMIYFLFVPDDTFMVEGNGDVIVKKNLNQGKKYLLYVYARDGDVDKHDTKYSE